MSTLAAESLARYLERRPTLVGIGNRWRADDAAGPEIVSRVVGRIAATCLDAGDAPERHLGEMVASRGEAILLLDAVDFGGAPGEIALFAAEDLSDRLSTTHTSSLRLLMRYLEAESGGEVLLVGIQPASVSFGSPMSAPVSASVEALAELLEAKLGDQAGNALASARASQGSGAGSRQGGQDHPCR